MSGLELGGVAVFAFTATTTMGVAGLGHAKPCIQRFFKPKARHHRKNHHLEPPHRQQLLEGPLRKEGVEVAIDNVSYGSRGVEFNGEVLFISAENGDLTPVATLGGCEVTMDGLSLVAVPPPASKIELTFSSVKEAEEWAKEFNEAIPVGAPEKRIQELIEHSMAVEKHLVDMRGRVGKVKDLEKGMEKMKKQLALERCGLGGETGSTSRRSSVAVLSSFMTSSPTKSDSNAELDLQVLQHKEEKEQLNLQVNKHKEEGEKLQALADSLKNSLAEHVHPDVHKELEDRVEQHKKESEDLKNMMAEHVHPDVHAQLNEQLQQHKQALEESVHPDVHKEVQEESQRHKQESESLKTALAETVHQDVHNEVHKRMQLHKQESQEFQAEAASLRQKFNELAPTVDQVQDEASRRQAESACAEARVQEVLQESEVKLRLVVQEFEQRIRDVERQLAVSQRISQEDRLRADSATLRSETVLQENEGLKLQIEELNVVEKQVQYIEEKMQQKQPQSEMLEKAVEELQMTFQEQAQTQRLDCAKQLEEQQKQHESEITQLKSIYEKSTSALANESDLTLKAGELAQENLTLKTKLAEKARRMEVEQYRFEEDLDSLTFRGIDGPKLAGSVNLKIEAPKLPSSLGGSAHFTMGAPILAGSANFILPLSTPPVRSPMHAPQQSPIRFQSPRSMPHSSRHPSLGLEPYQFGHGYTMPILPPSEHASVPSMSRRVASSMTSSPMVPSSPSNPISPKVPGVDLALSANSAKKLEPRFLASPLTPGSSGTIRRPPSVNLASARLMHSVSPPGNMIGQLATPVLQSARR